MTTSQPYSCFCLPSWKNLTGPPHRTAVQPPGPRPLHLLPGEDQPGRLHAAPGPAARPVHQQASLGEGQRRLRRELCMPTEKFARWDHIPHHPSGREPSSCFPVSSHTAPPGRVRPEPVRHRQVGNRAHTLAVPALDVAHQLLVTPSAPARGSPDPQAPTAPAGLRVRRYRRRLVPRRDRLPPGTAAAELTLSTQVRTQHQGQTAQPHIPAPPALVPGARSRLTCIGVMTQGGSAWVLRARGVLCLGVAESAPCP